MKCPVRGLYAITQAENKSMAVILYEVEAVLNGGAVMLQYRNKSLANHYVIASHVHALCQRYHVPLIINDDMHLAQALGAEGVHLGEHDGELHEARALLGDQAIIGITCYQSLEYAQLAQQQGANYVAFGRFFPSRSKPLAKRAALSLLTEAKQNIAIPIVAIGGILPGNATELLAAGADILAVIDGLFASEPALAVKAYQVLFN